MDNSQRRSRLRSPGILVIALGLVLGSGLAAQAFPNTPYPQAQLERTIRTSPFVGSTVSSRDNEASAYVARDRSLWMADDDGRGVHEINPDTGQLKRSFDETALSAVKEYNGKGTAGTWRVRDLEGLAYDANNDILYLFSGKCCTSSNLPTVFRLVRGLDGQLKLDSYRALASGSDFTAAAWNPTDGRLYVGAQSELRSYDFATNTVGAAFGVPHLSRITGMTFSDDGRDLWVTHALSKVSRISWASRTIVPGWSFDLASFGIQDARAVEVFDDRLWISDGFDYRPAGDPLSHAIFVFSLQLPPPGFNIVGNPGFETGLTGWKSSSDIALLGDGHTGGVSARLTNATGAPATLTLNDSPNWVSESVAGPYTVSAWVRSDNITGPIDLRIREYDADGVKLNETSTQMTLTPNWQQVSLTVTPAAGSDLDLNVYAYKVPNGARFDVDDVAITFG